MRIESLCVNRNRLLGAGAQNNTVILAHMHTMHDCGPINLRTPDTAMKKILDGILSIQL
jgi:hypothetical protein